MTLAMTTTKPNAFSKDYVSKIVLKNVKVTKTLKEIPRSSHITILPARDKHRIQKMRMASI